MSASLAIAVVGATGTVGETLVQLLEEREFPVTDLFLLASGESAGRSLPFRGRNLRVRALESFDFAQAGLAFFCAGEAVTRQYQQAARSAGCSVIDLSGGLGPEQAPRLLPEVNPEVLEGLTAPFLLACPSAAATALALALAPLRPLMRLRRVVLSACLSVSSLGRAGVGELARQTTELLNMRPLETRIFDRQIAFNLLAQVGDSQADGHTRAERRLVEDAGQVLAVPDLRISATCIQAPVFFGDSLSVALLADAPVDLDSVRRALDQAAGVELVEAGDYPTVVGDALGQDAVYVGRLRGGLSDDTELNLWIASDNARKGSALTAVQSAELLIKHYL